MPEWYLVILALAGLVGLGRRWKRLYLTLPLLAQAASILVIQAWKSAMQARFKPAPRSRMEALSLRCLTAFLHLAQPLARLCGRLEYGLSPWRRCSRHKFRLPVAQSLAVWSETWEPVDQRLRALEGRLRTEGTVAFRGGPHDRWDLEVRDGVLGATRLQIAIEEHGGGRQLVRVRCWPHCARTPILLTSLFALGTIGAAIEAAEVACGALGVVVIFLVLRMFQECGTAMSAVIQAVQSQTAGDAPSKTVQHELSRGPKEAKAHVA